jgi:hypothetical protein
MLASKTLPSLAAAARCFAQSGTIDTGNSFSLSAVKTPLWHNYTFSISQASTPSHSDLSASKTAASAINPITTVQTVTETETVRVSLSPIISACYTTTITQYVALSVTKKQIAPEFTPGTIFYQVNSKNSTTFLNGAIPPGASVTYASQPITIVVVPSPAGSATDSTSTLTLTSTKLATVTKTLRRLSSKITAVSLPSSAASEEDTTITTTETNTQTRTITQSAESSAATGDLAASSEQDSTVFTTSTTTGTAFIYMTKNWNSSATTLSSISNLPRVSSSMVSNASSLIFPVTSQPVATPTLFSNVSSLRAIISSSLRSLPKSKSYLPTHISTIPSSILIMSNSSVQALSTSMPTSSLANSSSSVVIFTQSITHVVTSYTQIPVLSTIGVPMESVVTISTDNNTWIMTLDTETARVSSALVPSASALRPTPTLVSDSALSPASSHTSSASLTSQSVNTKDDMVRIPPLPTWNSRWGHGPVVDPTPTSKVSAFTTDFSIILGPGPVILPSTWMFKSSTTSRNTVDSGISSTEAAKTSRSAAAKSSSTLVTPTIDSTASPAYLASKSTTAVADYVVPRFHLGQHSGPSTFAKMIKK